MQDVVIRSTSTDEERNGAFVPGLRLPRMQGCRYPEQGNLLGLAVDVRLPMTIPGMSAKTTRAVVLRDDAPGTGGGFLIALCADGDVLVMQGGKAVTLASARFRRKGKPLGDPNAGDDESGREGDEDAGDGTSGGAGDGGGAEAAMDLDEYADTTAADGEGAGWDVGEPNVLCGRVANAVSYLNSVLVELGPKLTVLSGSNHPAAFLSLSGRIGGLWRGWIEDRAGKWVALVDQRGMVAVLEGDKMPAFFRRDLARFPVALRRRGAAVKVTSFAGMDLHIDRPFGSVHEGVGFDGKPYMVVQRCDYGFFPGSKGDDDEEFDGYVGPDPNAVHVFIARQLHPTNGRHDELKAILGTQDSAEAAELMRSHIHPKMFGGVRTMKLADFKTALKAHIEREDLDEAFVPKTMEDEAEYGACRALAINLGLPSDQYSHPWPDEPTQYPSKGDNKSVSLPNSKHTRLTLNEMEELCGPYVAMLKDSGFPNHAHTEVLRRLSRTGKARTDAEQCVLRCREAYGDMCAEEVPPADRKNILRMASWGLVHPMGVEAMRAEMKSMKEDFDGEGGGPDDEQMSAAAEVRAGMYGWAWGYGMPSYQPSWTPMAAPSAVQGALDTGPAASTPHTTVDNKDADAAGIQSTPLAGAGDGSGIDPSTLPGATATASTGEGEDSPAPATNPPPPSTPSSNSHPLPDVDHKGGATDYPNAGADPTQLAPGASLPVVPLVEPLPIPDRAAAAPAPAPATTARSEDPRDRGPLSVRNPPTSGSAMTHAQRFDALIRYAAALALVTRAGDPAEQDALAAFLRTPVAGVQGGPEAAGPAGAQGRTAGAAGVPHALTPNDKRYLLVSGVSVEKTVGGEDDGTYLFIASTPAIDSYGESVEQTWDFSRFKTNPVILFAHNSHDLPIGRATKWDIVGDQLRLRILFSKVNPLGVMVQEMVDEGMLRAGSVGFMPGEIATESINGERRTVLKKNLLHEYSICSVPANPEALYIDEKMLDAFEGRMTRAFNEMLHRAGLPAFDRSVLVGHVADRLGAAAAGLTPPPLPAPAAATPPAPVSPPAAEKMAVPYKAYPTSDSDSWDVDAAEKRCRKFCSSDKSGAADKMDWPLYNSLFGHVDDDKKEEFGGHKLLHHDIVGDKIVTSKAGVMAAGNVLQGGQGGVNLPEGEEKPVKAHLAKHYKQFDLTAPWEREEEEKNHPRPTRNSLTGDSQMSDQIHRTDNPAARESFRQRGQLTIPCSNCGVSHIVDVSQIKTQVTGLETRVAEAESGRAAAEERALAVTTQLAATKVENDKLLSQLTKVELGPLTGVELYQLTPAEAESLAHIRTLNPDLYASQLASAKGRFERGKAQAEAQAKIEHERAVAAATAAGQTPPPPLPAGTPPTRAADPTPRLGPATVDLAAASAQPPPPPAGDASKDSAASLLNRISQRAELQGVPAPGGG